MFTVGDHISIYTEADLGVGSCVKSISHLDIVLVIQIKKVSSTFTSARIIHKGSVGWTAADPNVEWWAWEREN